MPMRSALVALACSRLGLAASAAANWAVDDSSALLQRYAEEESPQRPMFKVVPYTEVVKDFKKQFDAMIPREVKETRRAKKSKAKRLLDVALNASEANSKEIKRRIQKKFETAEKMAREKRKAMWAARPRLWRQEKNSTDYGLIDGVIEANRARIMSKEKRKETKALRKASEIGRAVISSLPQPMMPGLTPVTPVKSVAEAGASTPMTADDMSEAVENYRKQLREASQKSREVKARNDEQVREEEEKEKEEQQEEDREEEEEKQAQKEAEAMAQKAAAEERELKRKRDVLARQAARQRRKLEQDNAFPKHLFEEGVE